MVCGAGNCAVLSIGPVASGIGCTEDTWAAGLATVPPEAGTAIDSAARPPTAATGRTVREVIRRIVDRPRDAERPGGDLARCADLLNTVIPLLWAPPGV